MMMTTNVKMTHRHRRHQLSALSDDLQSRETTALWSLSIDSIGK